VTFGQSDHKQGARYDRQEDQRIMFDFGADGRGSVLGGPDAVGTLNGDLLEVRYSFDMRVGADYENVVYTRTE
jgi:hypothetical protein